MIGLSNKLCDTIGFMDISDFGNFAQLALQCAFSFGIKFCYMSFICISCIVLTKDCCSLCSFSKLVAYFFLIGSLSSNAYSLITLLLMMVVFTSTIWTKGHETFGSTTTCFFIGFTFLFLNIFCISLYLGQFMILCPMSPQIWQKYLISFVL